MTRDEMIGAISHAIVVGESNYIPSKVTAEAILNTILTALQEPTEEMKDAYTEYGSRNFSGLGYNAMLSASPLAPSKEEK